MQDPLPARIPQPVLHREVGAAHSPAGGFSLLACKEEPGFHDEMEVQAEWPLLLVGVLN